MHAISRLSAVLFVLAAAAGTLPAQTTPITAQLFAGGFSGPLYVCAPPRDRDAERLFVVEQGGRIRVRRSGVTLPAPFLNLGPTSGGSTGLDLVLSGGERGLLGMAFHPNYAHNGFFYVDYTRQTDGSIVVARYQVQAANPDLADPTSGVQLLLIPHSAFNNHNGGCLQFGPDGLLYIGVGDGGFANDPNNNAQNPNQLLGKLLRIDVDHPAPGLQYGIPPGNPYAGGTAGLGEIWAIGMRNPWRFSFDRGNGDLYIGDVGQGAVEEIDWQANAELRSASSPATVKNFGWRCMEGNTCTNLGGCTCNAPALTPPIQTYPNCAQPGGLGCAVMGGYVYRGCAIPDLRGTYFYADYTSNQIWSFRYSPGAGLTNFTNRTAQLAPVGGPSIAGVVSFGEDACGELYIVAQGSGSIFKLVAAATPANTGLSAFGAGTPGCNGAHVLGATSPPARGNPCFHFTCTNAPPSSFGIYMLADLAVIAGYDPFQLGVTFHIDLNSSFLLVAPIPSDAAGVGEHWMGIPNDPSLPGVVLQAQAVWFWPPEVCQPSAGGLSSSNGLTVTFLP
jgi:glucose/arabinose dehydrogenase